MSQNLDTEQGSERGHPALDFPILAAGSSWRTGRRGLIFSQRDCDALRESAETLDKVLSGVEKSLRELNLSYQNWRRHRTDDSSYGHHTHVLHCFTSLRDPKSHETP